MKARLAPAVAAPLLFASLVSCGTTTSQEEEIRNLNRPVDMAFACYGQMRLIGANGVADADDELRFQPHPQQSCVIRTNRWIDPVPVPDPPPVPPPPPFFPNNVPRGQEDLPGQAALGGSMNWLGFAVQSSSGTVAVIQADIPVADRTFPASKQDPRGLNVLDADLRVPGRNALSVGSQPIAIAGDASGCFMTTANAGSCDLSVIDVDRVYRRSTDPQVRRQSITNADGTALLAKPAAMVSDGRGAPIGYACPEDPQGLLYIAYPDCHAVAVIDAATGVAQASIRFDAAGNATVGDGNLACPSECGERMPTTDGGRPVSIELTRDDRFGTRRLAIGLDNRPVITVVDLDGAFLPTTIEQYDLEGDVGVIDVALTEQISMTGDEGWDDTFLATRAAQFVYAVATDGTVRVVDVLNRDHECETNVDPRFLRTITSPDTFSCFPIGQVGTPPRRAFARGPGIQLIGDDVPLSVVTVRAGVDENNPETSPTPVPNDTVGYFAIVTSSLGSTMTINIDDDNYLDFFRPLAPLDSQLALALPHQLRDGALRGGDSESALVDHDADDDTPSQLDCFSRGSFNEDGVPFGSPRAQSRPTSFIDSNSIAGNKGFQMPYVRELLCEAAGPPAISTTLPEVMFAVPREVRADVFPDLRGVAAEETWTFQWEGSLSRDDGSLITVDGPPVRSGTVTTGNGNMRLNASSKPYCAAGVEKFDSVQFIGCDPNLGSRQCGLGEVCFVHPDSTVAAGICLPEDRANTLGASCRDFAVSVRKYAVQQVSSGELVLSERRRVLRTSPVDGCTSDAQCTELALYDESLVDSRHPREIEAARAAMNPPPVPEFSYACAPDPTRSGSVNRCQMTCVEETDCESGTVCSGGFCIEGTIPPAECVAGVQLYTLSATDALVVIGRLTGYLHPWIEDAATGACVRDPEASPLLIGRVPLVAPPCPAGSDVTTVTPNPCSVRLDHTELVNNYTDDECTIDPETPVQPVTRQVDAIRFRNQAFTLNITDPTYPGDRQCRQDREGGLTGIPSVYPGFAFQFNLIGGFRPVRSAVSTVMPSRIVKSPDEVVWVLDEGDIVGNSNSPLNITGQILRLSSDLVNAGLVVR